MTPAHPPLEPSVDPIARAGVNMAGLARWAARTWPDRPAFEHENGERLTFAQLAARVAGLAGQLGERGVGRGDVLAVSLDSCSTFPLLVLAAADLGAAMLPLNPGFTPPELDHILGLVEPTHVVATPEFCLAHRDVVHRHGAALIPFRQPVPGAEPPLRPHDAPFDRLGRAEHLDTRVRFGLTSGSTGVPKAVAKTQRQWLLDGRALATVMELTEDDRVMSSQPLYYGDPFMLLMAALQTGATAVYLSRFRSQTFMENVARRSITKFMTIGSMPAMLLNTPPGPFDTGHRAVAAWSVAVPRHLHAELERRFALPWLELYGTAEMGVAMGQPLSEARSGTRRIGAGWLGRPMPGHELRLTDENGQVIEGDGLGMLEVRGPTVTDAYHRRPDATAEAFLPGGWYRSGDIMERRGADYRYVRRMKDIVRRAGENISCQEVEAVLRAQPGVVDAAVIPRPDPVRGEEVWAFLQVEDVPTQAHLVRERAEAIVSAARASLARHKLPRYVSFVDRFERTPTERIVKRRLTDLGDHVPTCDLGERR
ncbi:class I adenylate-forming enzyme family protein [Thermoactinospora rubra]|uniref:class I adenylate-forming enzyme family protein n=1 Tax=Thermoactinospora rubra TaxID=1088767 RepID=UPI001301E351|nr:AMP-binding protein [Thermoactinospora rubra]